MREFILSYLQSSSHLIHRSHRYRSTKSPRTTRRQGLAFSTELKLETREFIFSYPQSHLSYPKSSSYLRRRYRSTTSPGLLDSKEGFLNAKSTGVTNSHRVDKPGRPDRIYPKQYNHSSSSLKMVNFVQINLNHAIAPTTEVGNRRNCVYLVQEQHLGSIRNKRNFFAAPNDTISPTRAGIYI
jgi:hypothetical protein